MCGLVGIAGNLEFKDEATMKRLLVLDYFRGTDSTGFAAVRDKTNDVYLHKMASHPIDLFDSVAFRTALSAYPSKVFLGHNRAATLGKVNAINAHPFHVGTIIGAHNGTLDTASWTRLEDAIGHKTDVDSLAIFECIDKLGIEETIKLMEEGYTSQRGAWALTWYDTKDNTLNFLRNKHRPLWFAYTKEFDKVIWASEYPMIQGATDLSTHGYELYKDKEGYTFWNCKEDWLYMWDLDELVAGGKKVPKPRVKELKGRKPVPVVAAASAAGNHLPPFITARENGTPTSTNSTTTLGPVSTDTSSHAFLDVPGNLQEPYAEYMSRAEFEDLAKNGCSWCSADVDYDDVGVTVIETSDAVLCAECSGNETDQNRVYVDSYNYNKYQGGLVN